MACHCCGCCREQDLRWGRRGRGKGQWVKVALLSACQRLRRVTVVVRVRLTFRYADRQNETALLPPSPLPSPLQSPLRSSYPSPEQWHSMGATFVWLLDSICNFLRHSSKHSHTSTHPSPSPFPFPPLPHCLHHAAHRYSPCSDPSP